MSSARASGAAGPPGATVAVDRLAAGGDGVGRLGGKVVFVPLTAPGDVVEVSRVVAHRNYCRAELRRVVRPSPDRVRPPCRLFGVCGGCRWQHLAYRAQLDAKRSIVEEALRRIARIPPPPVPATLPSPREYGYRHRARLHAARSGAGVAFGFFASGSTSLVPVESCPVLHSSLDAVLHALAVAAARRPEALARCAEARVDGDWSGATVRLILRADGGEPVSLPAATADALRAGLADAGVTLLLGDGAPGALCLGPGEDAPLTTGEAFTQVNLEQNRALVALAVDLAAPRPGEPALDLFCGLGNLSLPLSAAGARVLGVDLDASAVRQAGENASRTGSTARFEHGDAASSVRELAVAGRRFPLVVLNPPRAGARETVAGLAALDPERVVVVSCDPATFARDAATLVADGFLLEEIRPVDLFPQTAHVETVALFRRARGGQGVTGAGRAP